MVSEFLLGINVVQHQCVKSSRNVRLYIELPLDSGYSPQRSEWTCLSFRSIFSSTDDRIIRFLGLFCTYADMAC